MSSSTLNILCTDYLNFFIWNGKLKEKNIYSFSTKVSQDLVHILHVYRNRLKFPFEISFKIFLNNIVLVTNSRYSSVLRKLVLMMQHFLYCPRQKLYGDVSGSTCFQYVWLISNMFSNIFWMNFPSVSSISILQYFTLSWFKKK